jgi:hypothetical protein
MSPLGQEWSKRLRLPAGKSPHEHMGGIVPRGDLPMPCHEILSLEVVAHPEHLSCSELLVLAVVIVIF